MQCYFRDQMQNPGMMAIPVQNPGMMTMPIQNPGMMAAPIQNPGMMAAPVQNPGMMAMPGQYNPMMNMEEQQQQLESMYPNTYNIIQPQVENICNNMEAKHGKKHCPSLDEMNKMVDQIFSNVENEVEAAVKQGSGERQFFGGGRRLLRDLIVVLLISNLIRRRRPFFGDPGFSGGFPYGYQYPYGGYPYFY